MASATVECTIGYYCLAGAAYPKACNEGRQTPAAGTDSGSESVALKCVQEVSQKWVKLPGVNEASPVIVMKGWILDGYYSISAGESDPMPTKAGSICPIGYTCSRGDRTLCPAGKYCESTGMTAAAVSDAAQSALLLPPQPCIAGFYCQAGTNASRPTNFAQNKGDLCPKSHYCPIGSGVVGTGVTATGTVCPAGYYGDGLGNLALTDCHKCPFGYTCEGTALLFANIVACPINKFCP